MPWTKEQRVEHMRRVQKMRWANHVKKPKPKLDPEEAQGRRLAALRRFAVDNPGFNVGRKHSEEAKLKIKEASLSHWQNPEYIAKMKDNEASMRMAQKAYINKRFDDISERIKVKEHFAEYYKTHKRTHVVSPSSKKQVSESAKLRWENPEERSKQAKRATEQLRRQDLKKVSAAEDYVAAALSVSCIVYERQVSIIGIDRCVFDFKLENGTLIEVDGCYWHGCERCGYDGQPRNRRADAYKNLQVSRAGLKLIRIPEHAVIDGTFMEFIK